MSENLNNNESFDLEDLLRTHQFSSRPTVYFSPFESLGDKMGVCRFVLQLMKEEVRQNLKRTQRAKTIKVFELVVKVLEDHRAEDVNQRSAEKRYLFDAGEEVMSTIQAGLKRGVDIFVTRLEVTAKKMRKGTRVICTIDCRFMEKNDSVPTPSPLKVPEPASKKPDSNRPATNDELDFSFFDDPECQP